MRSLQGVIPVEVIASATASCGLVSIILCSGLRLHAERNPFHSFTVSKNRQVQWRKISLPSKPGQLPLGVPARRLLNFCNTLGRRFFPGDELPDFTQTDHL